MALLMKFKAVISCDSYILFPWEIHNWNMSACHVRFESKTPKSINSLAQILARTLSETLQSIGRLEEWNILPGTGFCSPAKDWLTQNAVDQLLCFSLGVGNFLSWFVTGRLLLRAGTRRWFCILRLHVACDLICHSARKGFN